VKGKTLAEVFAAECPACLDQADYCGTCGRGAKAKSGRVNLHGVSVTAELDVAMRAEAARREEAAGPEVVRCDNCLGHGRLPSISVLKRAETRQCKPCRGAGTVLRPKVTVSSLYREAAEQWLSRQKEAR
jgi:DnaJ-class molecular chaperone